MVPLGPERRHRIQRDEIPEVVAGLRLRLREHLETKDDIYGASLAFRTLYRLKTHKVGKPSYPNPISWTLIEEYTNYGTISNEEGD